MNMRHRKLTGNGMDFEISKPGGSDISPPEGHTPNPPTQFHQFGNKYSNI